MLFNICIGSFFLGGGGLLYIIQSQILMSLNKVPLENTVGKRENDGNQHCLVFHPSKYNFQFFSHIYFVISKHSEKRRKCWKPTVLSFSHNVFYCIQRQCQILMLMNVVICKCSQLGQG